ncbi:(2Fe-2S)-binding protein [Streptomyces sp. CC219B]|uniref:(2Fe-2S)-binding protein n=1 Tax=Streptomyces sp. CC219B TaxID=3044574 RepID=UPI0024A7D466|nr:(2Fe-2S)-binding protein [Streptomyces sp. CC219B]
MNKGVDVNALRQAPAPAVAEALKDIASLGSFFSIELGGPDDGWHPVEETYARGVADLITATAERYDTRELRIGASIVQLGHAARLWSPVLACTVVHGIVPDLTRLFRADDGPALRLPTVPDGWYAPEIPQLTDMLYEMVMTRQLEALAAGLRVKVAPGLLAGNAASALVEAARTVLAARANLREPLADLVGGLLSTGRLAGTGKIVGPDLGFRRRSCCLYYRAPSGVKCEDCSLAG